jgi:NADH-quinone oxidoreductase subunit C
LPDDSTTDPAPDPAAAAPEAAVATEPTEADAPAVDAPPEPNAKQQELLTRIAAELGDAVIEARPLFTDVVVRVRLDAWRRAAEVAKQHLECDYLAFIAGIDWAPAPKEGGEDGGSDTSAPVQPSEMTFGVTGSSGRFQVFAHVQSTRRHWGVTFKADVDESDPHVESWVAVYPGADWHERECWEMYGFVFDGHPSLRHLYLPAEFEGHPLRKDFPLLARVVKPWPGLVDVEGMPEDPNAAADAAATDAAAGDATGTTEAAEGGESA